MRRAARWFLTLSFLPVGCGPNLWDDPEPAVVSDAQFDASVEEVWEALPQVYAYLGLLPASESDPRAHWVETVGVVVIRDGIVGPDNAPLARCSVPATGERTDSATRLQFQSADGSGTISVRTRLADTGEGTRMRTDLTVSTDPMGYPPTGRTPNCITTGRVESEIAEGMRMILSRSNPLPPEDPDPDEPRRLF